MNITFIQIEGMQRPKISDTYTACSIAEGFSGQEHTQAEIAAAWSYLIKTGMCWQLQGWYGRSARDIITGGTIDDTGNVNWSLVGDD
jgi:hypothetical protein